jgi:hypothetical protein
MSRMGFIELSTTVESHADVVTLTCAGTAEGTAAARMNAAFVELDQTATTTHAKTVVIDLRALEFATSSVLKVFVVWLMRVAADHRYTVKMRSSTQHAWQKRSLAALRSLVTPDVLTVETD